MKIVACYSVKGGVGKSTLAANLAWASAEVSRRRTLLWDLDPQGGAGYLLGVDRRHGSATRYLFSEGEFDEALVVPTGVPGLYVLPADKGLHGVARLLLKLGKKRRLAKLLGSLSDRYDRVILDCPPVLDELSDQIIRAADALIVPLTASPLARRGLEDVVEDLRRNHGGHGPLLPVFAMYDGRRKLHTSAHEAEPDWPVVPMSSLVERMAVLRRPVGMFAPRSAPAESIRALWTGIERRLVEG